MGRVPRGRQRMVRGAAGLLAFGLLLPSGIATAAPEEAMPEEPALIEDSAVDTTDSLISEIAGDATEAVTPQEAPAWDEEIEFPDEVVEFKDVNFKKCVAQALNLDVNEDIKRGHIHGFPDETLRCENQGIVDFSPLRYTVYLQELHLEGNNITHLPEPTDFRYPPVVFLDGNQISDLTPLVGYPDVRLLSLRNNLVSDLTPLLGVDRFDKLDLRGNQITDISPLGNYRGLSRMMLSGQTIRLDDVVSGEAVTLPKIRTANGGVLPLKVQSGTGTIKDGAVTWDMPAGGLAYLRWQGQDGGEWECDDGWWEDCLTEASFSGTVTQNVLAASIESAVPTVAGSAVVGEKLTAKPGNWTAGTAFTYQWKADGAAIPGATAASFTLTTAQTGKAITVTVTGSQAGHGSVSQTSAATAKVKGKPGWFSENGKWYYFGKDGAKQTGWVSVGRTWYYMNVSGVMQTGWVKVGAQRYYLDASGAMQTGWARVGSSWFYLKADGAQTTGWALLGGKWYYLNPSAGGAMATGWVAIGGQWYYMQSSGAMATGWAKSGSNWYYLNSSGVMHTGWLQLGNNWYYLKANGVMVTGVYTINGRANIFDSSGLWLGYASTPAPNPAPNPKPNPKPPANAYYKNYTEVWNAIGRPIKRGEPGYGSHLDRDGDGVGCEVDPRK